MNKKSTGLLLSVLGVISLVLITAGVTYAFFSYAKEGETENTISTGTITFLYDEQQAEGNGINIENALPMSDDDGIAQTGDNNQFNFVITSEISGDTTLEYVVTARKDLEVSTLANNQVKLYLENTGNAADGTNYTYSTEAPEGEPGDYFSVNTFADLSAPEGITLPDGVDERVMFKGTVPAAQAGVATDYTGNFTLKMWINGATGNDTTVDYSPFEFVLKTAATGTDALDADALIADESFITSTTYYALDDATKANYERVAYVNSTARTIYTVGQAAAASLTEAPEGFVASEQFYSLNGQAFKVTVNVYANTPVVSGN